MDKPLILLMTDYLDLFLPGRIRRKHAVEDGNRTVRGAIVHENVFDVFQCLFEQASDAPSDIFFDSIYRDDDRNLRLFLHAHFMRVNVFLTKQYTLYRGAPMHIPARALQREMRTISLEGQGRDSA